MEEKFDEPDWKGGGFYALYCTALLCPALPTASLRYCNITELFAWSLGQADNERAKQQQKEHA